MLCFPGKFILLKCNMSIKPEKYFSRLLSILFSPLWNKISFSVDLFTLTKFAFWIIPPPNPLLDFKKRQNIDNFFILGNIFVILSWMIFVGTLPIYVIFLDMLHCLAKKICLYPKHFLACHSNSTDTSFLLVFDQNMESCYFTSLISHLNTIIISLSKHL